MFDPSHKLIFFFLFKILRLLYFINSVCVQWRIVKSIINHHLPSNLCSAIWSSIGSTMSPDPFCDRNFDIFNLLFLHDIRYFMCLCNLVFVNKLCQFQIKLYYEVRCMSRASTISTPLALDRSVAILMWNNHCVGHLKSNQQNTHLSPQLF